jgi:hypothetical protein
LSTGAASPGPAGTSSRAGVIPVSATRSTPIGL